MDEQETQISKSEQKRQARLAAAKGRKTKKTIIWVVVLLIVAGVIYGLVVWSQKADADKPGEAVPVMEDITHIAPGTEPIPYNSDPPTSGQHFASPAEAGFYEEVIPDQVLIHNMEHGHVWISYRDLDDEDLMAELKQLWEDNSWKVVITPRPENDTRLAVAAWGRLLKLDEYDRVQVEEFIKAFINKGPERTPF